MHQVLTITNKRPADHSGKKTFSARNSSLYAIESQMACNIEIIYWSAHEQLNVQCDEWPTWAPIQLPSKPTALFLDRCRRGMTTGRKKRYQRKYYQKGSEISWVPW